MNENHSYQLSAGRSLESQIASIDFVVETLKDWNRAFGGDLDLLFILSVISHSQLPKPFRESSNSDDARKGVKITPISVSQIARTTGIPRQTVRRKLEFLRQSGFVHWLSGGWAVIHDRKTRGAKQDLTGLQERLVNRIVKFNAVARQSRRMSFNKT
jgi:DNA-binding transcriptional regulator YhcF (GntR family)